MQDDPSTTKPHFAYGASGLKSKGYFKIMKFGFDSKLKIQNLKFFILFLFFAFCLLTFGNARAALTRPPTNQGLVGYWNFNEGNGAAALDSSGKGNNGTLVNGPTWSNGRLGKALNFDGVNDYVNVANSSTLQNQSITIAFWVNPGTQNAAIKAPVDFDHCKTPNQGWVVQSENASTNRNYYFAYHNGTAFEPAGEFGAGKGIQYTTGIWQHIAYTKTGTTVVGYKNGVATWNPAAAGNATVNYNSPGAFRIGNTVTACPTTRELNGLIDDVRIYNRALSAQEVKTLYQSGATKILAPNNRGLVGYWNFNEGNGFAALDASGRGNNGTLTNGPVWSNGRLGKALSFDGSNDYVASPNVLNSATLTYSAWIRWTGANSGGFGGLVERLGGTTAVNSNRIIIQDSTSKILVQDTLGTPITSNFVFSKNVWYHIALTISSNVPTLYVNGVSNTVGSSGTWGPGTNALYFGTGSNPVSSSNTYFFNGLIDEVRVYNRALSAQEVKTLYQSGATKYVAPNNRGLVGYWNFNEGNGAAALDSSGKGNNGTLTNGPVWTNGRLGKALSFDGTNDYVAINKDVMGGFSNFTISAWINWRGAAAGEPSTVDGIVANWRVGGNLQVLFRINQSGDVLQGFVHTGTQYGGSFTSTISTNVWTHLILVYDGSTLKAYKNGVVDATTFSPSGSLNTSVNTLQLGGGNTGSEGDFNGLIDEVRVYNRALSAQEVKTLYLSR